MTLAEFPGITPHLTVPDTEAAVRFYRAAFGADELVRNVAPDGRVMHCELLLDGGRLLLHDEFPESGALGPAALGGSPVTLHRYVADVDAAYAAALAAGATGTQPPADTFWGDRYAQLTDPAGHRWSLATQREDLSPDELRARADDWSGGSAPLAS
ncbi:MAG TPA: VOC family protein [Pilimelia sp.]|nr:VOC family protein [Pilimelia sp.]